MILVTPGGDTTLNVPAGGPGLYLGAIPLMNVSSRHCSLLKKTASRCYGRRFLVRDLVMGPADDVSGGSTCGLGTLIPSDAVAAGNKSAWASGAW